MWCIPPASNQAIASGDQSNIASDIGAPEPSVLASNDTPVAPNDNVTVQQRDPWPYEQSFIGRASLRSKRSN